MVEKVENEEKRFLFFLWVGRLCFIWSMTGNHDDLVVKFSTVAATIHHHYQAIIMQD